MKNNMNETEFKNSTDVKRKGKREQIMAQNMTRIDGRIIGIRYDTDGFINFFNFRTVTEKTYETAINEVCHNLGPGCSESIQDEYPRAK
jgi:hypothetical protein